MKFPNVFFVANLKNLDLSDNKIGKNEVSKIVKYIEDEKYHLENFNIYGNLLGDDNIKQLSEAIGKFASYRMQLIYLSKYNTSDFYCEVLINMIGSYTWLRILNLSHNKFSNKGGTQEIKKLRSHTELRVLDLSWNNIGDGFTKPSKFYKELINFIKLVIEIKIF